MTEIHRPELHITPEHGVLDAPAGVLLDGNDWHVFYQYRPEVPGPARWAHTVSQGDPFSWFECDDVLAPVGGELTVRAGSVVPIDGEGEQDANLYFTSVTSGGTNIQLAKMRELTADCPLSEDRAALNPAVNRVSAVLETQEGFQRFRSPCVVPNWETPVDREAGHAGWLMLALTGDAETPTPVIATSQDGQSWDLQGALEFDGEIGLDLSPEEGQLSTIVAPRILRLRDEVDGEIYDILLLTLERAGIDISGYLVGTLRGTTFHVRSAFRRIDHGHDFTRPRNTNTTKGTTVRGSTIKSHNPADYYTEAALFGFINGIGRHDDPTEHPSLVEEGWANALTLPRMISLQDGRLYQTPPAGLPEAITSSERAHAYTVLCEVPSDEDSALTVSLFDADGNETARITHTGHTLSIDRSVGPSDRYRDEAPATAELADSDSDSLTIIVDGSTVEVFADGGCVAMTSRVYFAGGCSRIDASTTGAAKIERDWHRSGHEH
ncbi:GH32 C-terminal domain-containing protein [Corynebacterium propinquum]|uniref:GH32 C-terminal domain-containing protein n=1 Tax=Corynebacterium propinquum TaxID=43769 RepID=UPI0011A12B81|nr:GH32 C-terminal domain-containing protein [Corynebacterium propinquum]WKS50008.1 GH32 C-terminal domain-containing protein [Corynebacterium propinquum]